MKLDHDWSDFFFHHARPIEYSFPGEVHQSIPREENGEIDESYHTAFSWMETQVGFYPLFLAVGNEQQALSMTGYQLQWKKSYQSNNSILFSFKEKPSNGVFNDWMYWSNVILNSFIPDHDISERDKKHLFKYSWPNSRWIREAKKDPLSVQLVVPKLDLTTADLISVRNNKTKTLLERRGFTQPIEVRRIHSRWFI